MKNNYSIDINKENDETYVSIKTTKGEIPSKACYTIKKEDKKITLSKEGENCKLIVNNPTIEKKVLQWEGAFTFINTLAVINTGIVDKHKVQYIETYPVLDSDDKICHTEKIVRPIKFKDLIRRHEYEEVVYSDIYNKFHISIKKIANNLYDITVYNTETMNTTISTFIFYEDKIVFIKNRLKSCNGETVTENIIMGPVSDNLYSLSSFTITSSVENKENNQTIFSNQDYIRSERLSLKSRYLDKINKILGDKLSLPKIPDINLDNITVIKEKYKRNNIDIFAKIEYDGVSYEYYGNSSNIATSLLKINKPGVLKVDYSSRFYTKEIYLYNDNKYTGKDISIFNRINKDYNYDIDGHISPNGDMELHVDIQHDPSMREKYDRYSFDNDLYGSIQGKVLFCNDSMLGNIFNVLNPNPRFINTNSLYCNPILIIDQMERLVNMTSIDDISQIIGLKTREDNDNNDFTKIDSRLRIGLPFDIDIEDVIRGIINDKD